MAIDKTNDRNAKRRALIKDAGSKCAQCGGVFNDLCYVWDTDKKTIVNELHQPLKVLREWTKGVDMVCANCYITRHANDQTNR